jgi:PKD repeat protein
MRKCIQCLMVLLALMGSQLLQAQKAEVEPNNTQLQAQVIQLNDTLQGRISNLADLDFFSIRLSAGAYQLAIFYSGNVEPPVRDWFELKDSTGTEVKHYCFYPGRSIHLVQFKICSAMTLTFKALANTDFGLSNRDYLFKFQPDAEEYECDDTPQSARLLSQPGSIKSKIGLPGDVDFIRILNVQPGVFSAAINNPQNPGIPFALKLFKNANDTAPLASNTPGQNDLNLNISTAGDLYLQVSYADADTASSNPYLASLIYTAGPADTCTNLPVVGIRRVDRSGKRVRLDAILQAVDSLYIDWGDGSQSDSLVHTYANNGDYRISIRGFNDCGADTAQTEASILTAKFRLVHIDGVLIDSTVQLPLILVEGEFVPASMTGTVNLSNPGLADWVGLAPGKLRTNGLVTNLANGRIAGTFSSGSEALSIGDTLLFLTFKIKPGVKPGDSSAVSLDGALSFVFSAFINGAPVEINPSEFEVGSIVIVKNVNIRVNAKTAKGQPISNAKITITPLGGTPVELKTDTNGKIVVELPYAIKYTISCKKDTLILSGLTPNDVFIINRILVLLSNNNIDQYSFIAADFDCDGRISVNDGVKILQYIVGLLSAPPCGSYAMIPASHNFGLYPSPTYFNYPGAVELLNPDPSVAQEVSFIGVLRGDVNHSATNGFKEEAESAAVNQWTYAQQQEGNYVKVKLQAEAGEVVGGVASFDFDAKNFEFMGAQFLQAPESKLLVSNEGAEGEIKFAFVSQSGSPFQVDGSSALVELLFRRKIGKADFQLKTSRRGLLSQSFDETGKASSIALMPAIKLPSSGIAPRNAVVVYPNPVTQGDLHIAMTSDAPADVHLYDALGRLVFQAQGIRSTLVDVPTQHWAKGIYLLRVQQNGQSSVHKINLAQQ